MQKKSPIKTNDTTVIMITAGVITVAVVTVIVLVGGVVWSLYSGSLS